MPAATAFLTRKRVAWHAWLDLLGISNPGWAAVCGRDFAAPLTFSFPGRQIRSARISPEPAARAAARPARPPAIRLLAANSPQARPGDRSPARVQLTGDFLLRPADGYTVTLLLSGTPAPHRPPVQHHGVLTAGKIITGAGRRDRIRPTA